MQTNVLYYGDDLDILHHDPPWIEPESVDLIYLDPPFNSNATYNVIFKDESGNKSDAQLTAFDDTWHWGPDAEQQYLYLTNSAYPQGRVPTNVSGLVGSGSIWPGQQMTPALEGRGQLPRAGQGQKAEPSDFGQYVVRDLVVERSRDAFDRHPMWPFLDQSYLRGEVWVEVLARVRGSMGSRMNAWS